MKKVCIVGASGKLGQYMVQHALNRGYEVVGVCRERSVSKLDRFRGRIKILTGATNDRQVIKQAVEGCDGVLTVRVPWGGTSTRLERHRQYSTMRARTRASFSPAAGTSRGTDKMCIRVLQVPR